MKARFFVFGAISVLVSAVFVFLILAASPRLNKSVIYIPMRIKEGYGLLPPGFANLNELADLKRLVHVDIDKELAGIPTSWSNTRVRFLLLEPDQFYFQSFHAGLIDNYHLTSLKERGKLNFGKRPLSIRPIRCLVYFVSGVDREGRLKIKVDSQNDFNFSNNDEFAPVGIDWAKVDSLREKFSIKVRFESFREGKVVDLSVPILILDLGSEILGVNIPIHGEAEFKGTKILVCSQGFTSAAFDSVSIYKSGQLNERIDENENIVIENEIFRNLGCDINKQVLILEKLGNRLER